PARAYFGCVMWLSVPEFATRGAFSLTLLRTVSVLLLPETVTSSAAARVSVLWLPETKTTLAEPVTIAWLPLIVILPHTPLVVAVRWLPMRLTSGSLAQSTSSVLSLSMTETSARAGAGSAPRTAAMTGTSTGASVEIRVDFMRVPARIIHYNVERDQV